MTDVIAKLVSARAAGRAAEFDAAELPETPEAAYKTVLPMVEKPAAWKIGGANPWSQKVFGNDDPFYGALVTDEVLFAPAQVPLGALHSPLAEPEIALEIAEDGAPAPFARMGLSLEIPASVLPDAAKTRLTGQIMDRAGAGALWIGAIRPFDSALLSTEFDTTFTHNDNEAVAGRKSNVLHGGPLGAALRFLDLARMHGAPLAPGQWIATGGLNPAVPVVPGDRIRFDALGDTITADFI